MEALSSPEAISLRNEVGAIMRRQAPSGFKCIFLNCEMHETPGGMTTSGDLFAVTKPMFGHSKRNQWVLDANALIRLNKLGRLLMEGTGQDHVTLDLIISRAEDCKAFVDFAPLRRIGGDDDFFKTKHKAYVKVEPWLADVD